MAHGLGLIDWQAPWLAPYRAVGQTVATRVAQGQSCAQALGGCEAAGVRFVPQSALPPGQAYEQHIFTRHEVPTRDGLHDFFNGLVWCHFPLTKRRLNALQSAEIAAQGVRSVRGAVRDAVTVLDENAALLQAPDPLWHALQARDWSTLFITLRPLWAQARLVLFGHALLEKLVHPRKAITAHVLRVPLRLEGLAAWDDWLAQAVSAPWLAGKPFCPLPVLGVPGWWGPNEAPGYYDDPQVFRAARPRRAVD